MMVHKSAASVKLEIAVGFEEAFDEFPVGAITPGTAVVSAVGADWALILFVSLMTLFFNAWLSDSSLVKCQASMHCEMVSDGWFV